MGNGFGIRHADYPTGSLTDYRGPAAGSRRIVRGGGYQSAAQFCTVATRNHYTPHNQYSFVGFRVVRSPIPSP